MTRIPVPTACALVLALAGPAGASTDGSVAACTAQRLAPFVDPYGVRQDWPVASELPRLRSGGILLCGDRSPAADE